MDETAVSVGDIQMEKGLMSSDSRYSSGQIYFSSGNDKHVTAVVIKSAAGQTFPPFFDFAGKYLVSNWFNALDPETFRDEKGPHWLTRED